MVAAGGLLAQHVPSLDLQRRGLEQSSVLLGQSSALDDVIHARIDGLDRNRDSCVDEDRVLVLLLEGRRLVLDEALGREG